jgi:HSP20 family protein
MAATKTKTTKSKASARAVAPAPPEDHGLFDWLHRPAWLQTFTATPMRIEQDVDGDRVVVRAEMPGIDPERDVEINVSDGMLQIRAERREQATSEHERHHHSEIHYGSFARVISLPAGASADDVKATYRDGILEIVVPVDAKQAEATRVSVTRT